MVRIAIVGAGDWGINHVRAFARIKDAELVMVCDPSEAALARALEFAPHARRGTDLSHALAAADVDAVVLATPATAHAGQAQRALEHGKHVLVEKPLALRTGDAEAANDAATRAGRVLMVGHLMLYHPAVKRLREMVASGELGTILYVYSVRVNLGKVRQDESALWSLGPHDVSMILHLLRETPVSVSARGGAYLQETIEDVVFVNLRFASGVMAQVQLSWLDPRKERRLTIVGSKKMVDFDDVSTEKLHVYDKGVDRPPAFTDFAEFLQIRNGDILIPRISGAEPLDLECRHFVDCVIQGRTPLSDGASGLEVVRVLSAAQRSLEADGAPVRP